MLQLFLITSNPKQIVVVFESNGMISFANLLVSTEENSVDLIFVWWIKKRNTIKFLCYCIDNFEYIYIYI